MDGLLRYVRKNLHKIVSDVVLRRQSKRRSVRRRWGINFSEDFVDMVVKEIMDGLDDCQDQSAVSNLLCDILCAQVVTAEAGLWPSRR